MLVRDLISFLPFEHKQIVGLYDEWLPALHIFTCIDRLLLDKVLLWVAASTRKESYVWTLLYQDQANNCLLINKNMNEWMGVQGHKRCPSPYDSSYLFTYWIRVYRLENK